jgi:hypothetical protein
VPWEWEMIRILIENKKKKLNETRLDPQEFPRDKGWQRVHSHSAQEDMTFPTGDGFVEVIDPKTNLNYSHPFNYSLGVINTEPVGQDSNGPIYEEYINENIPDPQTGIMEMRRHIAPGRAINFGFTGRKRDRDMNVLIVSIDGSEPRIFVRTLT